MRILLDTSAWSARQRDHAEITELCRRAETISLTPIVIGELLSGFRRGSKRRQNELGLRGFLQEPQIHVSSIDEETARCYAEILEGLREAGHPIGSNDVWIAASAMQYGLTLVTTDQHFLAVKQIAKEVFEV